MSASRPRTGGCPTSPSSCAGRACRKPNGRTDAAGAAVARPSCGSSTSRVPGAAPALAGPPTAGCWRARTPFTAARSRQPTTENCFEHSEDDVEFVEIVLRQNVSPLIMIILHWRFGVCYALIVTMSCLEEHMTASIFLGRPLPISNGLPPDWLSLLLDDPRRSLKKLPTETPFSERVLLRLIVQQDGCWTYSGSKHNAGYGVFSSFGTSMYVHRISYAEFVGPLINGLTVDHLCYNRACGNPFHLQQVTHRINILRSNSVTAQNARKTHCAAGHELQPRYGGGRWCGICDAAKKETRFTGIRRGQATHCHNGHEWTTENTYWRPDGGGRQCISCIQRRAGVTEPRKHFIKT